LIFPGIIYIEHQSGIGPRKLAKFETRVLCRNIAPKNIDSRKWTQLGQNRVSSPYGGDQRFASEYGEHDADGKGRSIGSPGIVDQPETASEQQYSYERGGYSHSIFPEAADVW